MISICIHRLRVDALPAAVMAMGTFLVPPFIYSVLNAPAWGAHLVPIMIAFFSYRMLSRSNVQAIPLRQELYGVVIMVLSADGFAHIAR